MIRPVESVAALAPYALADLADGLVSLAQNESAFPPSPAALSAGRTALGQAALYPDPDWTDLRQALGEAYDLDPAAILCGAGSMELIGALIRAYAGPGDEVLAPAYSYLFVATACCQAGAAYRTAAEDGFVASVDTLLAAVTPRTRIVFLCNPGNPTSTRLPTSEVLRLRASLPDDVLLVVDQAYGEFDPQDHHAVFDLVSRGDTVVTRTLSKAYGLAGARTGWGLFPEAVGIEVRKLLNPNNVSGISQTMAAAAVRDQAYMRRTVAATTEISLRFCGRLREAGYDIPVSQTNFVLIPFADAPAARAADSALRSRGFLLRGMGGYGLAHCLRATMAAAETMERVADILVAQRQRRQMTD